MKPLTVILPVSAVERLREPCERRCISPRTVVAETLELWIQLDAAGERLGVRPTELLAFIVDRVLPRATPYPGTPRATDLGEFVEKLRRRAGSG